MCDDRWTVSLLDIIVVLDFYDEGRGVKCVFVVFVSRYRVILFF